MRNPLYDLVLGNIKGVSHEPNPGWVTAGSAVVTRSQADKWKKPLSPLIVAGDGPGDDLQLGNHDTLSTARMEEGMLKRLWEINTENGEETTKRRQVM